MWVCRTHHNFKNHTPTFSTLLRRRFTLASVDGVQTRKRHTQTRKRLVRPFGWVCKAGNVEGSVSAVGDSPRQDQLEELQSLRLGSLVLRWQMLNGGWSYGSSCTVSCRARAHAPSWPVCCSQVKEAIEALPLLSKALWCAQLVVSSQPAISLLIVFVVRRRRKHGTGRHDPQLRAGAGRQVHSSFVHSK